MKAIFQKLVRKELADSIPHDDLIERQRFALFRIYSFTSFLASFMTAAQILGAFSTSSTLSWTLFVLSAILLINFYQVRDWHKLPVSYLISVVIGFAVVHIQAYTAGGVLNTGTIYMCVIIMTAFMLLGTKAGKWLTALAVASIIFLFYATEYTSMTSYALFNNDSSLIHQDALTTFILGVFLVAAQSNNLHSGKNVIIERITGQKNELERQNRKLEEYTLHLENEQGTGQIRFHCFARSESPASGHRKPDGLDRRRCRRQSCSGGPCQFQHDQTTCAQDGRSHQCHS